MPQTVMLKKLKLYGLTPKKDVLFIIVDWNAKVGSKKKKQKTKTWSKRQIWLWSTKRSRSKANRVCQENTLVIENTLFQQKKRRFYIWTSPDGQYCNQIDYILCSQRWRSSIQSAKKQDPELAVAQIMNSLLPNPDLN